jgi:hypothetical protein
MLSLSDLGAFFLQSQGEQLQKFGTQTQTLGRVTEGSLYADIYSCLLVNTFWYIILNDDIKMAVKENWRGLTQAQLTKLGFIFSRVKLCS